VSCTVVDFIYVLPANGLIKRQRVSAQTGGYSLAKANPVGRGQTAAAGDRAMRHMSLRHVILLGSI
jgi:hypothetical protein